MWAILPARPWPILRETYARFRNSRASSVAASLAFYTIFSLAPLLIISVAIAGILFGRDAAQGELSHQMEQLIGLQGAKTVQELIAETERARGDIAAMGIGFLVLFYGASQLFVHLQEALNAIWGIKLGAKEGFRIFLQKRLFSFAMVVAMGFLLLVSLVLSAFISGLHKMLSETLPFQILLQVGDLLFSFALVTVLFALVFKILPDEHVPWRNVWVGAIMTSLLFSVGKVLIGIYLGNAAVTSSFGAAGSLAVLLLWFSYSAQILLFGAQFTRVCADLDGKGLDRRPKQPAEQALLAH